MFSCLTCKIIEDTKVACEKQKLIRDEVLWWRILINYILFSYEKFSEQVIA
jgi:hypothetical protein